MKIVSHRPFFAHHKMVRKLYTISLLARFWIKKNLFLVLEAVKTRDRCVLRSPDSLGF